MSQTDSPPLSGHDTVLASIITLNPATEAMMEADNKHWLESLRETPAGANQR